MEPSKQTLDFPATPVAAQGAAVLRDGFAAVPAARRDQLDAQILENPPLQPIPGARFRVPRDPTDRCRRLCRRSIAAVFHGGIVARAWVRREWLHSAKR